MMVNVLQFQHFIANHCISVSLFTGEVITMNDFCHNLLQS